MNELIVKHEVSIIDNMDTLKEIISQSLTEYRSMVVTVDTIAPNKKIMADLNKQKKSFTDDCKKFLNLIELPIKEFKLKKKEIEDLFTDARSTISIQVEKFENDRLELIAQEIINHKKVLCNEAKINPNSVSVEDLIKLSSVTTTNKITKATTDNIKAKINAVLLENMKIAEQKRLDDEAKAEADRIAVDKYKEQARIRAEAVDDTSCELIPEAMPTPTPNVETDKKIVQVTVVFDVKVPARIPEQAVKTQVYNRLTGLDLQPFKVL
jgi:hypothetical protein